MYLNEMFRLKRAATSLTHLLCRDAYREFAGVTRKVFSKSSSTSYWAKTKGSSIPDRDIYST
jgi:hypothetical protein